MLQKPFQVGLVDGDLGGWLAIRQGLDGAFIEGLEEAHFRDGVFFAAGEGAAVLVGPGFQGRLVDEYFEAEGGGAVERNGVGEFAARVAVALGAIAFVEIVLINVAIGSGVGLDSADSIGARHVGIICWWIADVNEGVVPEGNSELAPGPGVGVPVWDARMAVLGKGRQFATRVKSLSQMA